MRSATWTCRAAGALAVMMAAAMAGCASAPSEPQSAPAHHAAPHTVPVIPEPPALPQSSSSDAPPATLKPMADDQCGAQALQYLVGKPRTDIPVPLDPGARRVVCSTCVVTQDFRADRQTITFNSDTGLITSVKCG